MAGNKMLLLALVSCFGQRVLSVQMVVTLQPEKLSLSPDTSAAGGRLTVTCSATSLGSDYLTTISVARKVIGSSNQTSLVTWITGTNNNTLRNDSIPAMTVTTSSTPTGSVTPSSRTVVVTMERTKCEDAGNYICKANIVTGTGASETLSDIKTLDVEVTPGNITLIPDPKGTTEWTEGQTLRLPCSGSVGTVVKNVTQIKWMWEYKKGGGSWISYENTSDIQSGETIKRSGQCYERWSSTLTRVLTVNDTGREYRCYIQRNSLSFTQFAGTHYVGIVNPEGYTTPPPPNPGAGTSKANVAPIVGGVVAALVVIIVIIVVVVIVVRRRSNREENYDADEPGNKPADNSYPPTGPREPYNLDAGVITYSQPNRFRSREPQGVSNKAMDEAGDKPSPPRPSPPRYANDFHQGLPNRGYDHDREAGRSRYSSDEDGTDARVNTSQLSIGLGDPSIGTAI